LTLLQVENLNLSIARKPILDDISLSLEERKILGVVGESGSGKSLTALSIMQLLPNFSDLSGSIRFAGTELTTIGERAMCRLRGDDIGMVFQEPMTALNPLKTIGQQIAEGIRLHARVGNAEALERTEEVMEKVGLPPSRIALSRYPHELSGGQRQRVGIAIACAMRPKLLIADEPTTALDVTIQAQILDLLAELVERDRMALMLISHDLGVVAGMADDIAIMRRGKIVETGDAVAVLTERKHSYTQSLADASSHVPERKAPPVISADQAAAGKEPLLNIRDLVCEYALPRAHPFEKQRHFRAVNGVDLCIYPGQTMGLVGESGCGKSTLARAILGLHSPSSGELTFDGFDIAGGGPGQIANARRELQVVFQDPYGSFNPRHRVESLVGEPLYLRPELSVPQKRDRVIEALEAVGLSADDRQRYPHAFSGGQRQRIAIARALVNRPKLIVADEPVSALDVSIRAQILDLLSELRDRLSVAYLFISHDLTVVRAICDEVMVMREGTIVEHGATEEIFAGPQTEYARQIIAAAPDLERELEKRRVR